MSDTATELGINFWTICQIKIVLFCDHDENFNKKVKPNCSTRLNQNED